MVVKGLTPPTTSGPGSGGIPTVTAQNNLKNQQQLQVLNFKGGKQKRNMYGGTTVPQVQTNGLVQTNNTSQNSAGTIQALTITAAKANSNSQFDKVALAAGGSTKRRRTYKKNTKMQTIKRYFQKFTMTSKRINSFLMSKRGRKSRRR